MAGAAELSPSLAPSARQPAGIPRAISSPETGQCFVVPSLPARRNAFAAVLAPGTCGAPFLGAASAEQRRPVSVANRAGSAPRLGSGVRCLASAPDGRGFLTQGSSGRPVGVGRPHPGCGSRRREQNDPSSLGIWLSPRPFGSESPTLAFSGPVCQFAQVRRPGAVVRQLHESAPHCRRRRRFGFPAPTQARGFQDSPDGGEGLPLGWPDGRRVPVPESRIAAPVGQPGR